MTDRPILFKPDMVRAIIAGTKTQTRRLLYSRRLLAEGEPLPATVTIYHEGGVAYHPPAANLDEWYAVNRLARVIPGDRFWVRETWRPLGDGPLSECTGPKDITFLATDPEALAAQVNYRPSIHMPRWASRLTLKVTARRIERLQAISDADAIAEGIDLSNPVAGTEVDIDGNWWPGAAKRRYLRLWDRINGDGSSGLNPWVLAFTLEEEKKP